MEIIVKGVGEVRECPHCKKTPGWCNCIECNHGASYQVKRSCGACNGRGFSWIGPSEVHIYTYKPED